MASYQASVLSLIIGHKVLSLGVENEADQANDDLGASSTSHIYLILRRIMRYHPSAVSRITKPSEASTAEAFAVIL